MNRRNFVAMLSAAPLMVHALKQEEVMCNCWEEYPDGTRVFTGQITQEEAWKQYNYTQVDMWRKDSECVVAESAPYPDDLLEYFKREVESDS